MPRSPATTGAQATADQGAEASGIEAASQPSATGAVVPPIGAKITASRTVGTETMITLDKGLDDGLAKGWTGYVVDAATGGKLAGSEFALIQLDKRTSTGKLPFTLNEVDSNPGVVLVPPPAGP